MHAGTITLSIALKQNPSFSLILSLSLSLSFTCILCHCSSTQYTISKKWTCQFQYISYALSLCHLSPYCSNTATHMLTISRIQIHFPYSTLPQCHSSAYYIIASERTPSRSLSFLKWNPSSFVLHSFSIYYLSTYYMLWPPFANIQQPRVSAKIPKQWGA